MIINENNTWTSTTSINEAKTPVLKKSTEFVGIVDGDVVIEFESKKEKDQFMSNCFRNPRAIIPQIREVKNGKIGKPVDESLDESYLNESARYNVSGYIPGTEDGYLPDVTINDPAKAIEKWFILNKKNPTCVAIYCNTEDDARKVLEYAVTHESQLKSWASKYDCPYKFNWLMDECKKKLSPNFSRKLISWSGDQVHPFALG